MPTHPKKYLRGTSVKAWDAPEAPLLHRQKLGHLSTHYILLHHALCVFLGMSLLQFSVLFAAINGWTPTNFFWRRFTCFPFAKNTPFFTLIVQRVFSFSRTAFSFHFFCLNLCSDLLYLCIKVYFDLWSMLVFIKRVVLKRFEWCWKREKMYAKKWYKKELVQTAAQAFACHA